MQPQRLLLIGVSLLCAAINAVPLNASCPDLRYVGRAGDEFLFMPVVAGLVVEGQLQRDRRVSMLVLSTDGERAGSRRLVPGTLSPVAGSGRRGWVARRVDSRSSAVAVRPFVHRAGRATETVLEVPFRPHTYSWAEDTHGPWLFVGGAYDRGDFVAGFTLGDHGWTLNDVAPAPLRPPEYDATTETITVAGWRFARGKKASRIRLPNAAGPGGLPLIVDVVQLSPSLAIASAYKSIWSSVDGGETWKRLVAPWSETDGSSVERVPGVPNRAVFSWRATNGDLVVSEWTGSWSEVLRFSSRGRRAARFVLTNEGLLAITGCRGLDSVDSVEVTVLYSDGHQCSRDLVVFEE